MDGKREEEIAELRQQRDAAEEENVRLRAEALKLNYRIAHLCRGLDASTGRSITVRDVARGGGEAAEAEEHAQES